MMRSKKMIVKVDPDYLEHASKSKYKGGFTKDGKNTSAYNHDYYIHNKEKWKNNGDDIEEWDRISRMEDGEAKTKAIVEYYAKQHSTLGGTTYRDTVITDRHYKNGKLKDKWSHNSGSFDYKDEKTAKRVDEDQKRRTGALGRPRNDNGKTYTYDPSSDDDRNYRQNRAPVQEVVGPSRKRNDSGKTANLDLGANKERNYKENRAPVQEVVGPGRKRNDSGKSASVKGGSKNKIGPDWKVYPEGADLYDPMYWDVVAPPNKRKKGRKPVGKVWTTKY